MVSRKSKLSPIGRENGRAEPGDDVRANDGKRARKPKKRKPLDEATLRDLALSYVARFSTTGAKLEQYLARKLRERGVAEDADGRVMELDVAGLVSDFVTRGYVDDDAYARAKSRDLTARGYGAKRVEQALWAAGVEEPVREDNAPSEAASRRAAMLLAKKRRFGPYGLPPLDNEGQETEETLAANRKQREKQVAAMLRAGHSFEHVRFIMDASQVDDIETWLIEAEDEEDRSGDGYHW